MIQQFLFQVYTQRIKSRESDIWTPCSQNHYSQYQTGGKNPNAYQQTTDLRCEVYIYTHNGIIFNLKKEGNSDILPNTDKPLKRCAK